MGAIDEFAKSLVVGKNQNFPSDKGTQTNRNAYAAIVVSSNDPLEQNRIRARIIGVDQKGEIKGGRDKDIPDDKLPFAIPLSPSFLNATPLEGEMVILILDNPEINTSPRFWVGPIISSKLKYKYQAFKEAVKIFDYTDFGSNQNIKSRPSPSRIWPDKTDVALMGRDDSQIILKPRELHLSSGIFKKGTFETNKDHPSFIQLIQFDSPNSTKENPEPIEFSQANMTSTNINIYSPRGKFRKKDLQKFETNEDLKNFGDTALNLHPSVFGDELIKLLDIIIRTLSTHIHTPQSPPAPDPNFTALQEYTVGGKLQDLISKHVRIN